MKQWMMVVFFMLVCGSITYGAMTSSGKYSRVQAGRAHPAILEEEFIFEQAPFKRCHASTITEASNGALLCAFFGGTKEGDPDVAIWASSKDNLTDDPIEHATWSPLQKIAEDKEVPCWNPVLFTMPSGEILLFYKAGKSPREWSGYVKRSTSQGQQWTEEELLPAGIFGPIRSKPLLLKDGTLLCGSSVESWKRWGCWVEITKDGGRSWIKSNPINVLENLWGVIQPSFFRAQNDEIKMVMRSYHIGKICTAHSHDHGHTWSNAQPTSLPNPNAGVEALSLADGRVLLVFNDSIKKRYPLSLALSTDGGDTWERVAVLEDQMGEFSYPAAIQTQDGLVHITYTYNRERIKHVVLDPNKL